MKDGKRACARKDGLHVRDCSEASTEPEAAWPAVFNRGNQTSVPGIQTMPGRRLGYQSHGESEFLPSLELTDTHFVPLPFPPNRFDW